MFIDLKNSIMLRKELMYQQRNIKRDMQRRTICTQLYQLPVGSNNNILKLELLYS